MFKGCHDDGAGLSSADRKDGQSTLLTAQWRQLTDMTCFLGSVGGNIATGSMMLHYRPIVEIEELFCFHGFALIPKSIGSA